MQTGSKTGEYRTLPTPGGPFGGGPEIELWRESSDRLARTSTLRFQPPVIAGESHFEALILTRFPFTSGSRSPEYY
jgi:hypothetical protein